MELILHRLVRSAMQISAADGGIIHVCHAASAVVGVCAGGVLEGTEGPHPVVPGSCLQQALQQRASQRAHAQAELRDGCRAEPEKLGLHAMLHVPCLCVDGSLLAVLTLVARSEHALPASSVDSCIGGLAIAMAEVLRRQTDAERSALRERAHVADSERWFSAFMRALPAVAWVKDAEGRYTFVNDEFCRLWDFGPDDVLGKTDYELFARDVARQLRANDLLMRQQRRALRMEEVVPTPDGSIHTWMSTKFPLSADAQAGLVAGIALDITERKRAEHALREGERRAAESERNLSELLDALADGIVINQAGTLVYANEAAAAILGVGSAAQAVHRPVTDFVPADLHSRLTRDVQQALLSESGKSHLLVRPITRPDGSEVFVEFHASRIDWQGAPALAVLLRDISERHRREQQMQLTDRLSAAGTLAAGIAHEINNPLSFVSGNLSLIKERLQDLGGGSPSAALHELERMVSDASEGAERIRRIARAMRTLVRDASAAERSPVAIKPAVDAARQLIASELRNRAALVLELRPTPVVLADETRLTQVLVNLLTNAAHAIEEGHPEAHAIRVSTFTSPQGSAVIEVADDGCGITSEALKRIFDPFFTTKPVGTGTGLGLAIVHNIISSLDGEISVTSKPGVGTSFRISLPAAEAQAAAIAPEAAPAAARAARSARVLIVDDEPAVARVLAAGLGRSFATVIAHSARDGLLILENEPVDVVVSDIMMPGMTGMDFFAEIGRRFPHLAPRTVFMTGGSYSREARAFLESVPNQRVDKPFDFGHITAVLNGVLRSGG